jgi:hypothetical protein
VAIWDGGGLIRSWGSFSFSPLGLLGVVAGVPALPVGLVSWWAESVCGPIWLASGEVGESFRAAGDGVWGGACLPSLRSFDTAVTMTMPKGGGGMAQRGGPWRLAGYAIPEGRVAPAPDAAREVGTAAGERSVRWIVSAYVLGVVGGGLVALVGLSEGWW